MTWEKPLSLKCSLSGTNLHVRGRFEGELMLNIDDSPRAVVFRKSKVRQLRDALTKWLKEQEQPNARRRKSAAPHRKG